MTEFATETEATVETTQGTEDTEKATNRRGRPRPEVTIERDNRIYDELGEDGKTRAELVESTGLTKNEVYLSLYRLNKNGRVERARDGGAHKWTRVANAE